LFARNIGTNFSYKGIYIVPFLCSVVNCLCCALLSLGVAFK